jgi:hypothetical protein
MHLRRSYRLLSETWKESTGEHHDRIQPRHGTPFEGSHAMTEPSIAVTRDIDAPAARLFGVLARPAAHRDVDGSGMVRKAHDDTVLSKIGDVFVVSMFLDGMGDYIMENRVVEFEPERRIAWEPVLRSIENPDPEYQSAVGDQIHYQWGWQFEPLAADRTRVTTFFDCSRSPEWLQEAVRGGEQWRPAMEASLKNLEKLATGS